MKKQNGWWYREGGEKDEKRNILRENKNRVLFSENPVPDTDYCDSNFKCTFPHVLQT